MYFIFCILGFAIALFAQHLFDAYFFELGKIGSSLLYLIGVFGLPKYLFSYWITRPNGKANRICNTLYTETLVFLRSSNYATDLTNISYTWMALYFHCVSSLNYESKTLAGHVILCYQKMIAKELAPFMKYSQIQSHVNNVYDYVENAVTQNRFLAYDLDCPAEAISISKLIAPDATKQDFSERFKSSLETAHRKVWSILRK